MTSMIKHGLKYYLVILISQFVITSSYGITARFSYSQLSKCAPAIVRFTNNSTNGTGITYIWDFSLGAIVTTNDDSIKEQLFSKAGQYKVTLKVTDGVIWDSTSTTITVFGGPSANFIADKAYGCPPLVVNFTSTSTSGESDIINTSWDFRNGDYANGNSAQYTYNNTGTNDIILKVTDKNGCYSIYESDKFISVCYLIFRQPIIRVACS